MNAEMIGEIIKRHNQEENQRIQFSGAVLFGTESETLQCIIY
ncbi:hypothetical protein QJQ58_21395 [Paenibacillus dendritiformis]|nr:hypothetical protein [Paenibacillus dendritiformis]WGU93098.1 hypothetical protein QJQ58_21395 [Paenibacillus dendritiformis]